jgi:lactoylglutathione lyase
VQDVPTTVAFYEAAFGLTACVEGMSDQYVEMETGSTLLAFCQEELMSKDYPNFRPSRPDQPPCAAEIAFVTENIQADYDRAVAAKAAIHVPLHQKPWGQYMAHLRDPTGVLVELCSHHSLVDPAPG